MRLSRSFSPDGTTMTVVDKLVCFYGSLCLFTLPIGAIASDNTHVQQQPSAHTTADDFTIDPEILATIRHPELGLTSHEVRAVERSAYYHILHKARDADLTTQKQAARQLRGRTIDLAEISAIP